MKKILMLIIILFYLLCFIIWPDITVESAKNGIMFWYSKLLPVLFPCIIISNIFTTSNIIPDNTNLSSIIITVCGFVCGFPIGSKLSVDFYLNNLITKKKAQILCNYANQLSLSYICGFILLEVIPNNYSKIITLIIIYVPSLLVIIIYIVLANENKSHKKTASRFQINMQIIDAGIISGFETLIKLCGYIVMFSIVVGFINEYLNENILKYIIIGILENTNGIIQLINSNLSIEAKYILSIAIVSFGGISCIFQTASIIKNAGLSLYSYIKSKILICLISVFLAYMYLLSI